MWLRMAVLLTGIALAVNGIDVRLFRRYHGSSIKVDCFDYPEPKDLKYFKHLERAYHPKKLPFMQASLKLLPTQSTKEFGRRADFILSNTDEIIKEHAKLVQDINSLRQVLSVPPLTDDSKDYEDSIFHEILETSTTPRPKKQGSRNGIPIILAGGASETVNSPPLKVNRQTFNLVGTSVSPRVKHPYPFVTTPTRSPFRVCMTTPLTTKVPHKKKREPSLWEQIIKIVYPR